MSRNAARRRWAGRRAALPGTSAVAVPAPLTALASLAAAIALAALLVASETPAWAAAPPPASLSTPQAAAAEGSAAQRAAGVEVSPSVRQQLRRIQEQWLHWVSAADRAHSDAAVSEMLATAGLLGMNRLPDLSLGALAWAVEAARRHDFARAGWSLEAAERLDPQRPEAAFAEAAVARAAGDYLRFAAALCRAYPRLFLLPLERYLWLQDLLIWSLYLLLLTGGLFVCALMATRGGGLFHDLSALLGRRLPRGAAAVLAAVALLWPLALPGRFTWLLLLWSLLLWGYASSSERTVLIGLWLLLGAAPLLIAAQKRAVAVRLSPPVKALESLRQRRLYGGLFADLGLLRSSLPDSPAVKHLLADVHRTLGQWDTARGLYRDVLEVEPQNASALVNLGVYAFNRGDTSGAIQYFQQAAAADPRNAAQAQFDLSQAFNEAYLFDEAHRALAQAKTIDAERVDRWLRNAEQERVVAANGGLALIPDIERSLVGPASAMDLVQHGASVGVALAAILLAVALHLARRPYGYSETQMQWRLGHRGLDTWRRVLVPGLSSAEAGDGVRAFLALLAPVGLLMLPRFERLGYRIPWGYDAGNLAAWALAVTGLLLYLGARLRWELRNAV
jgi:tetratricopeptide (TPR) repeat protein